MTVYNCSIHQQRWLRMADHYKSLDLSKCNIPHIFMFTGSWNVDRLRRAFNLVLRDNEILRTSFPKDGREPTQLIHPPFYYDLEHIDVCHLERDAQQHIIDNIILNQFSFHKLPLFKAKLLQIKEEKMLIVACFHHLIADVFSGAYFQSQLSENYSLLRGDEVAKAPIAQYREFADHQRARFARYSDKHMPYWRKKLDGAKALTIPYSYENSTTSNDSGMLKCEVRLPYLDQPELIWGEKNIRPVDLIMLALYMSGRQLTGQKDMAVAMPISERNNYKWHHTMGFLSGPAIFRQKLEDDYLLHDILIKMAAERYSTIRRYVPFGSLNAEGCYSIVVNYIDMKRMEEKQIAQPPQGLSYPFAGNEYVTANSMGLDLFFFCFKRDDCFEFVIHYNLGRYNKESMDAFWKIYNHFLTQLTLKETTQMKISDIFPEIKTPHEIQ